MKRYKKIILVDDDEITNTLNEIVIKSLDLFESVTIFPNSEEGLDYFKTISSSDNCPEWLFLDLNMPVLNGFEFIKELHSFFMPFRRGIKIILLTTSSKEEDKAMAELLGFDDHLVKPLTFQKITSLIGKHDSKSSTSPVIA